MSRLLRIAYPGAWSHVMNRGRRVEHIFLDQLDYKVFVELLQETSEAWNIRIATFLMRKLRRDRLKEIGKVFKMDEQLAKSQEQT